MKESRRGSGRKEGRKVLSFLEANEARASKRGRDGRPDRGNEGGRGGFTAHFTFYLRSFSDAHAILHTRLAARQGQRANIISCVSGRAVGERLSWSAVPALSMTQRLHY